MKRFVSFYLSAILCAVMVFAGPMTAWAKPDWPADTGIQSQGGIVMDADSGTVLFGQGIHEKKAPASITKILTALVVLEHSSLDEQVTYSHDAVYDVESGSGNKNAMEEGDVLSVEDALYLMLLTSCNQSANALAEHVGGSLEGFAAMMNQKVEELGCKNSHFANPSGLNDDSQLTTPYDMALIAKAAFENPTLLTIASSKSHQVGATINHPNGMTASMEHKLLITTDTSSPNYYPYAVAGKTGYTSVAGQTLVTYAQKDGRNLIAVTMKSTDATHYQDTIALLNFGFNEFQNVSLAEHETELLAGGGLSASYPAGDLSLEEGAVITLPKDAVYDDAERALTEELPADSPYGAVALLTYTYNERKIGQSYVISAAKAEVDKAKAWLQSASGADGETGSPDPSGDGTEAAGEGLDGAEVPSDGSGDLAGGNDSSNSAGGEKAAGAPGAAFSLPASSVALVLAGAAGLAAAGALLYLFKRKRDEENRLREERRRRRRERLAEIGCTQEDFDKMVLKREEERERRRRIMEAPLDEEPEDWE